MEMKALWTAGLFLLTVFVAGYVVVHQGSLAPVIILGIVTTTVLVAAARRSSALPLSMAWSTTR